MCFFTSALDCGEWSASLPGRFTPGERLTVWEAQWTPEPVCTLW